MIASDVFIKPPLLTVKRRDREPGWLRKVHRILRGGDGLEVKESVTQTESVALVIRGNQKMCARTACVGTVWSKYVVSVMTLSEIGWLEPGYVSIGVLESRS